MRIRQDRGGGGSSRAQLAVAKPSMFGQRRRRSESLAAVVALDLLATVGVHPFVATEVGELGVRLGADLAAKRLDRAVNVLVLLEAARRRERLAATSATVSPRTGC